MRKFFVALAVLDAAMFAYAPVAINAAPYESTMLLIQKIFYFHFATWMACTLGLTVCGVASAWYLFKGSPVADRLAVASAELVVIFTLFGLVSGSLWARKAWGIWWDWEPRLTMAFMLELIFLGYIIVRRFGGPGSEKLAAAMGIFGAATGPFIYKSVDWWRTIHPKTSVMRTLADTSGGAIMWNVVMLCVAAFLLLFGLLLTVRMQLEQSRAELDRLYLAAEE
jgi:heme exporter protein C